MGSSLLAKGQRASCGSTAYSRLQRTASACARARTTQKSEILIDCIQHAFHVRSVDSGISARSSKSDRAPRAWAECGAEITSVRLGNRVLRWPAARAEQGRAAATASESQPPQPVAPASRLPSCCCGACRRRCLCHLAPATAVSARPSSWACDRREGEEKSCAAACARACAPPLPLAAAARHRRCSRYADGQGAAVRAQPQHPRQLDGCGLQ